MEYRNLGNSGVKVSAICLGTMTWGEQNSIQDAHHQLNYAFDQGVNFIDTAEMYPIPPSKESYGRTEEFIGKWEKFKKRRDEVILATKVVGPFGDSYIRDGKPRLDEKNILKACEESLKRLGTDYIDLYQLHWPDRSSNFFGKKNFVFDSREEITSLEETLFALKMLKDSGKVRHFGVSNETPWGVMSCLKYHEQKSDLPRIQSVQNPYSLLNRTFEIGLAEIAMREKVGLLAYSPLGFGTLSGKYLDGQRPLDARLSLYDQYDRYSKEGNAAKAIESYVLLARKFALSPVELALAFVNRQTFVTSNVIGATTLKQLEENIGSIDIELSPEVLDEIEMIANKFSNPCP